MGKTLEECYEVLGLEYGASEAEIKSAYRKKALQCHPDKNPDDPLSTQKFQELGHAYRRLTGEEDSDGDDDFDDDDMELWRDFFFFLFREEIMAKVRCTCYKCGRAGENEDDDFMAYLAKEQEEKSFTEEEMAQFTSFASLKEQREANKKKFCDERNQSSGKTEQKTTKGHKPKLKSNKQLKMEQWRREKEISELAAQINQSNSKESGKKTFSKDAKTKEIHQQKSSVQTVDEEKVVKQHTECGANKRNARKKKNRNKARQQGDKETDSNQTNGFMKTTINEQNMRTAVNERHTKTAVNEHNTKTVNEQNMKTAAGNEQKLTSSFGMRQDAVRNVTIKPETTRRQDDVTGRLPRYHKFTAPRMRKARAHARAQDSTQNSYEHVPQKQTGRGWFENQKPETASPRPSYGSNIWQQRQEKQQFLAELQPSNQSDEELQLQMALELSRKQAEIDAQQREINMLEKQMKETFEIENELLQTTTEEETQGATATDMGPDSFPSLGDPVELKVTSSEAQEWDVESDSEEEWQESAEQLSNFSGEYNSNDGEDEASEQLHQTKNNDLDEEHPSKEFTSSSKGNMTVPIQMPQVSRGQDSQALVICPYGKNCCLGRRCMYSHPPSLDNRKRPKSAENDSSFEDQFDCEKADECNLVRDLTEECTLRNEFCEEHVSDLSCPGDKNLESHSAVSSNSDESLAQQSLHSSEESSASYESAANDSCTMTYAIHAGDRLKFESTTIAGATELSNDLNQDVVAWGDDDRENFPQSARDDLTRVESQPSLEDCSLWDEETPEIAKGNDDPGINNKDGSTVSYENSTTSDSNATGRTVYVIADQSQFPFGLPAARALTQSVAGLPPVGNLSAGANLQNPQHSSRLPLNYASQMSTMQANLIAQTLGVLPQNAGPAVTIPSQSSATSQNSANPSLGETLQTQTANPQPNIAASSTSQAATANGFPSVPGFPFLPSVFPFLLNPANAAANASLMAAAGASGMPFPMVPGISNQQGGGLAMNQTMLPPYMKTDLGGGVSPLGQYLPMQAQLNGLPGMAVGGSVQVPRPTQVQPQSSQPGVCSNPQSSAPTVQQPLGFPFPLINPQAYVNFNAAMAAGMSYPVLQNGGQTSLLSGQAPSQVQAGSKATEQSRMDQRIGTKGTDVKHAYGEESGGSGSCGSKTPSLRRPATVPKVIQHQTSQ